MNAGTHKSGPPRDAELARLGAEHDHYTAQALVLRYIGRLDARDRVEAIPPYDPAAYLRKVEHTGVLPWESSLKMIDGAAIPGARQHAIRPPAAADVVFMPPALVDMPVGLIDRIPVEPVPGTVGNMRVPLVVSDNE